MPSASLAAAITTPIQQDFTEGEGAIGRAGYIAYTQGRIRRAWDQLKPHERVRWCLAARIGLAAEGASHPAVLRAIYHTHANVDSWADMQQKWRAVWGDVAAAMDAARDKTRFDERTDGHG